MAGERCDVETLEWSKKVFRVPVLDHWWQTGENFPHMSINIEKRWETLQGWEGILNCDHQAQTQQSGGSGFSRSKQLFDYPFVKKIFLNYTDTIILLTLDIKPWDLVCILILVSCIWWVTRSQVFFEFIPPSALRLPLSRSSHTVIYPCWNYRQRLSLFSLLSCNRAFL